MLKLSDFHKMEDSGSTTLFYEGINHYFISENDDLYSMMVEKIVDGEVKRDFCDYECLADAIGFIEEMER